MHRPEFNGATNPLVAEEWLSSIQVLLEFVNLMDLEKILCASYVLKMDARYWWETVKMRRNITEMTWKDFMVEFNEKFYNQSMLKEKQNELKNKKQGNMTVTDAVLKFNQLAHLCPNMAPNEEERGRRMLEMFRPEFTEIIDTGETPPKTVANCVDRALRAEYYLAKVKRKELNSLKIENMTGAKTRITPIIQVNGRIKATIRHGKVTNGRVTLMDLITRRSNEGTINGIGIQDLSSTFEVRKIAPFECQTEY